MAVKKCKAGIFCREIHLHFLVAAKHHDVLDQTRGRFARDFRQLETSVSASVGFIALFILPTLYRVFERKAAAPRIERLPEPPSTKEL